MATWPSVDLMSIEPPGVARDQRRTSRRLWALQHQEDQGGWIEMLDPIALGRATAPEHADTGGA